MFNDNFLRGTDSTKFAADLIMLALGVYVPVKLTKWIIKSFKA